MMTTSIPPDAGKEAERVAACPRLPRDAGGPVFAEPWQAQAFALAVKLSEEGHFTWKEWAAALGDELRAASDRGEPDRLLAPGFLKARGERERRVRDERLLAGR